MVLDLFIVFALPILFSLLLTPVVIRVAKRVGAIDQPNERKIHSTPIPRLGGVAIFGSLVVSTAALYYVSPSMFSQLSSLPGHGFSMIISLTLVLAIGIWDDMHSMNPGQKFIGQLIAATIMYVAGFRISTITDPFSNGMINLGIISYPATILWIVGVTNAVNLIDGLDGLASGVSIIASLTIFAISALKGDLATAMLVLMLAGAILGFLKYNFNPARIFLGDSGSLVLGFSLAVFSMQSSTKGSAAVAILVPLLALGLPIMDTFLSMTRRFFKSVLPKEGKSESFLKKLDVIFLPDKSHIHHQLIARGFSHRNVVLILYLVAFAFGVGAFVVTITNNIGASLILVAVTVATIIGVRQLRYREMMVLRNGILLPMYEWPIFNHRMFQGFLDLVFILGSYSAALAFTVGFPDDPKALKLVLTSIPIVGGTQLLVLYLSGLYKNTTRHLGIGDLLKMVKSVALAGAVTGLLLAFAPQTKDYFSTTLIILNFYLLFTTVIGARVSFHILNYIFRRETHGERRALIYGASTQGILTLQQIFNDSSLNVAPVGFIDDSPHLEGKNINGFPIFGGHWKLQRLINSIRIDEIIIATDTVKPEVMRRLKEFSRQNRVTLRKFRICLEDVGTDGKKANPSTPSARKSDQMSSNDLRFSMT
jgi:UDP-GlcNAc:undecaprenyl-phosphate GlcNAc-1-phosphate transferase